MAHCSEVDEYFSDSDFKLYVFKPITESNAKHKIRRGIRGGHVTPECLEVCFCAFLRLFSCHNFFIKGPGTEMAWSPKNP